MLLELGNGSDPTSATTDGTGIAVAFGSVRITIRVTDYFLASRAIVLRIVELGFLISIKALDVEW